MTKEEIQTATGGILDDLTAQHVMGWQNIADYWRWPFNARTSDGYEYHPSIHKTAWQPSEKIAQAYLVIEKAKGNEAWGWWTLNYFSQQCAPELRAQAVIYPTESLEPYFEGQGPTPTIAICRAALLVALLGGKEI